MWWSVLIIAGLVCLVVFIAYQYGGAKSDKRHSDEERKGDEKASKLKRRWRDSPERRKLFKDKR